MRDNKGGSQWKRYPKYKDSGVEWLGEIPEGWDRDVFSRNAFYQEGPGLRNWQFTDEGIRVICVTNITDKGIDFSQYEKFISAEEYNNHYSHFTVQNGDLLLSSSGNSWGKIAEYSSAEKVILNTSTIRINETQIRALIRSFLKFILQSDSTREQLLLLMTGSCQPNFGPSHLSKLLIPIPNIPEQTAIASFLDRETTRIDALIEKKQRQIELLQEKRAALISQAVTKGLDPTVPMRDSGVPWLGEVPEHWVITRLKYCVDKSGSGIQMGPFGSMLTQLDDNFTGYKLYGQENIIKNDFNELGSRYISYDLYKSLRKYVLNKGDLVLTRKGSLGQCKKVPNLNTPGIGDSDTIRIRPNCEKVLTNFLVRILHESQYIQDQMHIAQRGAIISGLNSTIIENILIILPPIEEQKEILQYCESEVTKNERTIEKISMSLNYLSEYRSALISAAVTGKIDVRETISAHSEAQS